MFYFCSECALQHARGHGDDAVQRFIRVFLLLAGPFHGRDLVVDAVKVARVGRVHASTVLLHDEACHCGWEKRGRGGHET